jgi:hypothetical protein
VLFAGVVDRCINVSELSSNGSFTICGQVSSASPSATVGVASPAVPTEGFAGQLGDVRTAHHDRNSSSANGIGTA